MLNKITLNDGRTFRVELNWNAIVAFLESSDRDDLNHLASLSMLKPSDLAALLAAGINEGERLEGHDAKLTAEEVGALCNVAVISEFIKIVTDQTQPKGQPKPTGKKE